MPALKKRKSLGKTAGNVARAATGAFRSLRAGMAGNNTPSSVAPIPPVAPRPQMLRQARRSIESGQSGPAAMHNDRLRSADQIAAQSQARVNRMFAPRYDQVLENIRAFQPAGTVSLPTGAPAGLRDAANRQPLINATISSGMDARLAAQADTERRQQFVEQYNQRMADDGRVVQRPDGNQAIVGPMADQEAVSAAPLPPGGHVDTYMPRTGMPEGQRQLNKANRLAGRIRRAGGLQRAPRTAQLLAGMGPAGEYQMAQLQQAEAAKTGKKVGPLGPAPKMSLAQAAQYQSQVQQNPSPALVAVGAVVPGADGNNRLSTLDEINTSLSRRLDTGAIDEESLEELKRLIESYKTDPNFKSELNRLPLLQSFVNGDQVNTEFMKRRLATVRRAAEERDKQQLRKKMKSAVPAANLRSGPWQFDAGKI